MTDSLGYRRKFGVSAPSTNTSVQPEFDSMRPVGVTRLIAPPNWAPPKRSVFDPFHTSM